MYSKSAGRGLKESRGSSGDLKKSLGGSYPVQESLFGKKQISVDGESEDLLAEIYEKIKRSKKVGVINGRSEVEACLFQTRTSQRVNSICGLVIRRNLLEDDRRKLSQIFFQEQNPKYKLLFAEAYTQVLDELRLVYSQYNEKFWAQKQRNKKKRV